MTNGGVQWTACSALESSILDDAWCTDDEGTDDEERVSVRHDDDLDGGLWWNGAVDVLLPALRRGESHEHAIEVGWCGGPVGLPHRITVECVDEMGKGEVVSSTFVDLLPVS